MRRHPFPYETRTTPHPCQTNLEQGRSGEVAPLLYLRAIIKAGRWGQ